jgi:hypothetical protein
VFIFDTATNSELDSIPGMAVGASVLVNPDGKRLYVGRGNSHCRIPKTNENGSPLSEVNLTTQNNTSRDICLHTSVGQMVLSRDVDRQFLIVANGTHITVFDAKAEHIDSDAALLNDIELEADVAGMGIAEDNSLYAYIPGAKTQRFFAYNPSGLKPKK